MSVEDAIYAALKGLAPTYPDVAAQGGSTPYITYQTITGIEHETLADGGGARRVTFQIDLWSTSKAQVVALAPQAKTLLRSALTVGEIRDNPAPYEPDTKLYRASFDVSIWA